MAQFRPPAWYTRLAKAKRRLRYGIVQERQHGGRREGAGRPKKALNFTASVKAKTATADDAELDVLEK